MKYTRMRIFFIRSGPLKFMPLLQFIWSSLHFEVDLWHWSKRTCLNKFRISLIVEHFALECRCDTCTGYRLDCYAHPNSQVFQEGSYNTTSSKIIFSCKSRLSFFTGNMICVLSFTWILKQTWHSDIHLDCIMVTFLEWKEKETTWHNICWDETPWHFGCRVDLSDDKKRIHNCNHQSCWKRQPKSPSKLTKRLRQALK